MKIDHIKSQNTCSNDFFFAKTHVKSQETKLDKLKYPKTHKFASKRQKNNLFLILTCYTTQMDAMGNS